MRVLMCFGFHPGGLGYYLERAFSKEHDVFYCGIPYFSRGVVYPGFGRDVDIAHLVEESNPRPTFLLYVDSGTGNFPRGLERSPIPTVGYLVDVHLHMQALLERAPLFDYVFLTQKDYVPSFRKVNPNVYWLPFAADLEIHRHIPLEKVYDVGFVGHVHSVKTPGRAELLDRLARHFRMNDYRKWYHPQEIPEVYCRSKIVFNKPAKGDLTLRPFEALSCGTLCITERIGNGQSEVFQDRKHIVEYGENDNIVELIEYYLSRDKEREEIAKAGHSLVASRHTYLHRVREILGVLSSMGWKICAPIRHEEAGKVRERYMHIYASVGLVDSCCDLWRKYHGSSTKAKGLAFVLKGLLNRLR